MAEYKHKPNTARLFPNKYKEKNEKAPSYKGNGNIQINGDVEISLWVNYEEGTDKVKSLYLGISEPYKKGDVDGSPREVKKVVELSDEVPF
jgi:ArsR family metal-binding transcriptional regulator